MDAFLLGYGVWIVNISKLTKKYQIEKKNVFGTVPSSSCFCHGASQYCCLLNAHG